MSASQVIPPRPTPASAGVETFLAGLTRYFSTTNFTDVIIKGGDREFPVHCVVLGSHSQTLINHAVQVQNSRKLRIEINDFSQDVVQSMPRYMYTFDYEFDENTGTNRNTSAMAFHAEMYRIASTYEVSGLKACAKEKFVAVLAAGSWSVEDFTGAIAMVYATTPLEDRGLRDVVVETSHRRLKRLLEENSFSTILRVTPHFAADLIPFLHNRSLTTEPYAAVQRYRCPSCSHFIRGENPFGRADPYYSRCGHRRSDWDDSSDSEDEATPGGDMRRDLRDDRYRRSRRVNEDPYFVDRYV